MLLPRRSLTCCNSRSADSEKQLSCSQDTHSSILWLYDSGIGRHARLSCPVCVRDSCTGPFDSRPLIPWHRSFFYHRHLTSITWQPPCQVIDYRCRLRATDDSTVRTTAHRIHMTSTVDAVLAIKVVTDSMYSCLTVRDQAPDPLAIGPPCPPARR